MRAGWMRPSAMSRSIACLAISRRYGIEAGEDDGARRVVDDEIDAGRQLQGADVPPLPTDDASLQIVARQIDDRHRRLDRMLRGAALDGLGDVLLRAVDGRFARFGVEPLQQVGRSRGARRSRSASAAAPSLRRRSGRRRVRARAAAGRRAARTWRATASTARLALGERPFAGRELLLQPLDRRSVDRRGPPRGGRPSARAPATCWRSCRACRSACVSEFVRLLLGVEDCLLSGGFRRRARRP